MMKHQCSWDVALATGKHGRLPIALFIGRVGVAHMNPHDKVDPMFPVQDVGEGIHHLAAEVFQVDIEI